MQKTKSKIFNNQLINLYKKEKKIFPCLFLDRDGVIIKDCHYIKNPELVALEEGALRLIKTAFYSEWMIVIITNQSGINKKILTWNDYYQVTRKMISLFDFGNPFAAIYANSSETSESDKSWRKPNPEMILQASRDLPVDLSKSILIGDRHSDLQSGFNAKIPNLFHVKTGHGEKERKTILFDKILRTNIKLINNLKEFPLDILD